MVSRSGRVPKSKAMEITASIGIDGGEHGDEALLKLLEETLELIKAEGGGVAVKKVNERKEIAFQMLRLSGFLSLRQRC